MIDGSIYLRRDLMIRFVRAFYNGTLPTEIDHLPIVLRPRDGGSSRCCVYHDRAVIKYRLMSLLGFSCEDEQDETRTLASYLAEASARQPATAPAAELPKPRQRTAPGPSRPPCPSGTCRPTMKVSLRSPVEATVIFLSIQRRLSETPSPPCAAGETVSPSA